jgi:hypothetical protein
MRTSIVVLLAAFVACGGQLLANTGVAGFDGE